MFGTPLLIIIFNRPSTTQQLFNLVRKIQPKQLFVAADGPREGKKGEEKLCKEARKIATSIDWECQVHTLFREKNLGCGFGVSSAISWFFEHVEEGIILEDDCLPSQSFFMFCEILLDYYRNIPEIMHISGNNFQYGRKRGKGSYYFSRYTHNWGWATWRRAWKYYDHTIVPKEHRKHNWDAQWFLSVEKQHGVSILPNVNLVKNIGFGLDATHTTTMEKYSYLNAENIEFPLTHPTGIRVDKTADEFTMYTHFRNVNPNLIWLYKSWKILRKVGSKAKKALRWISGIKRENI